MGAMVGAGRRSGDIPGPCAANHVALTPLAFLQRTARVYPHKTAVIHGASRTSYRELLERCVRLASALRGRGVGSGDTVSVLAPNVPALLEAHYGVAMAGAVLNAINTRLDAATVRYILAHARSRVLLVDTEYGALARAALDGLDPGLQVIDIEDAEGPGGEAIGGTGYDAFLREGDAGFDWAWPQNEWQPIALNYTSGTTGNPKGVLYHHRGACLNAMGNALAFNLRADSVYLWTLPMFHCNGWTYPWAVTLAGGTHVCLRQVEPQAIFGLIQTHRVNRLCGAPVVLNMLAHSPHRPAQPFAHRVEVATGGAAPPSSVISAMEALGFRVTHLYGLTETFGPSLLCEWQDGWEELPLEQRAAKVARQGVQMPTAADIAILDTGNGAPLPADGTSLGELAVRGNTVMLGYLDNPEATAEALRDGWFHTGDLAVMHPDGYVEIKDRAKDIIISGGENISSLEVEEVLYRHPQVLEAAVVARPDDKWGESPCAFVTLEPGAGISAEALTAWCRERLAGFKVPRSFVFEEALPKTSTGKIQKFMLRQRARELCK